MVGPAQLLVILPLAVLYQEWQEDAHTVSARRRWSRSFDAAWAAAVTSMRRVPSVAMRRIHRRALAICCSNMNTMEL